MIDGLLLALLAQPTTPPPQTPPPCAIRFTDEAAARGLTWVSHCGDATKKRWLVEEIGLGCALFDMDGDGDLDLFLADACRLAPPKELTAGVDPLDADWRPVIDESGAGQCRLLRNDGSGRFEDVTEGSGAGQRLFAQGAIAVDHDGDGDVDLYLTCFGSDRLLENDGRGHFTDVTARAKLGDRRWSVGAAFLDADRDGDLDLYVANYFSMQVAVDPQCWRKVDCPYFGIPAACGPKGMVPEPDVFYANQGDGTFAEASEASGIRAVAPSYGLGVVAFDWDLDGDVDLYVGNDSRANHLFDNDGKGRFTEIGDLAGCAVSRNGVEQASMGLACGDFDGNGLLDLACTNFSHDDNTVYANQGDGMFLDVTSRMGFGTSAYLSLGWGTDFVDLDQDGALDFFVANGHVYPEADQRAPELSYRQRNLVYRNVGGRFEDVTGSAGPGLERRAPFRGAAFGDVDDDGDVDVVVMALDEAPSLLVNQANSPGRAAPASHWLLLALEGAGKNRSAIGARAVAEVAGKSLLRVVRSGGSFASTSDPRLHFAWRGADAASAPAKIDRLTVTWPDGKKQLFADVAADRVLRLVEDGKLEERSRQ
jgi:hypothetical protein